MRRIIARGTELALPELGHSVRVIVEGLRPDTWYWYRFYVGNEASRIGRTRTAPLPGSLPSRFTFALASCQNYQQGYYTAYKYKTIWQCQRSQPHLAQLVTKVHT